MSSVQEYSFERYLRIDEKNAPPCRVVSRFVVLWPSCMKRTNKRVLEVCLRLWRTLKVIVCLFIDFRKRLREYDVEPSGNEILYFLFLVFYQSFHVR
jgi:hypothetical protein